MKEIFIKNVLEVDVDGARQENRYIVRALYDVDHEGDGEYSLEQRIIEDVTMSWKEIEKEGGIVEVNKQFKEGYDL